MLVWARRIEVQKAQAAVLSDITKSQKFQKVKMAQKPKKQVRYRDNTPNISQMAMQILWGEVMPPGSVQYMGKHAPVVGKWVTSRRHEGVGGTMWLMKWNLRWHQNHKEKK